MSVCLHSLGGVSLEQLASHPAATVIQLYKARQNAFEMLLEQKSNAETQLRRLETQHEKLQSDLVSAGNHAAKLEAHVAELQERAADATNVVAHLRRVNEEVVAILQTYEKNPDEATGGGDSAAERLQLLDASLKQADVLVQQMEASRQSLSTPAAVKKYEVRIERLEKELAETRQQHASLAKHLEKAELELAVYEKRLGKGEFNVETTKIVHLSVNPTREVLESKASEVAKLREEVELLRSRLESASGGADVEVRALAACVRLSVWCRLL